MGSGSNWRLLLYFFFAALSVASSSLSNHTDRLALLEFKATISGDPSGILRSWNDSTHFCLWGGVFCSKRHDRVTVLDLNSRGLSGSISPHIGNLTFLEELALFNNTLSRSIPPEIGRLRRLQRLLLYNNSLAGEIPSNISGCPALTTLHAANNNLAGELPWQIGFLSRLQFLHLRNNGFTGSIPPSFGNISSIRILSVAENRLSGGVPESLGKLKSLQRLELHLNDFNGEIPDSVFNLSYLTHAAFGFNRLRGTLPRNLGNALPNLENFDVAYNELVGSLPDSLSNASNMVQLQLQGNGFTGSVPGMAGSINLLRLAIQYNFLGSDDVSGGRDLGFLSSLTSARKLQNLFIGSNSFGGGLPEQIGNLSSSLEILDLSGNRISGSIPDGIQNLTSLQRLWAHENKLSGTTVLSIVAKMQSLEQLFLDNNDIAGSIPSSIGNLDRLMILRLASNRLEGEIPAAIENCKKMVYLDLSGNNLSGVIPPKIMGLTSLSVVLNLSRNHFTGGIPVEVGNLKNLGDLDFSHNMLSNSIPSSLGKCVRLELVFLQANFLQGDIPSSFESLRGIQQFDISSNKLSGQVPKFFEGMSSLQLLNLSYNKFEGEVPAAGVLKNSSIISVIGNVKLCGGLAELKLPSCNFGQPKKKLSYKWKVFISTVSSMIFMVFVATCLLVFRMKRKGNQHIVSSDDFNMRVSYQSLHKATDGFSATNLIGVGSFGSVYKGVVNINGKETTIAIKVFNLQRRGASNSFLAECEVLKNTRHRNLVRILTVCLGVDYQGNDFKALVYEFMVNGSLENWLHSVESIDDPPRSLNFFERLNIAIHVAYALDYIHNLCETPIVHCDLKPDNVLLDEDMIARVSDFGLAKFLQSPDVNLSSVVHISSSICIKGTIGYAPPEYGTGNEISIQGDMYSYGILLLEMFTGRKPTDESLKGGLNLRSFVNFALSEKRLTITEVLDPILLNELLLDQISEEALIFILKIGVACSSDSMQERPSISEVLTRLSKLLDRLNCSSLQGK